MIGPPNGLGETGRISLMVAVAQVAGGPVIVTAAGLLRTIIVPTICLFFDPLPLLLQVVELAAIGLQCTAQTRTMTSCIAKLTLQPVAFTASLLDFTINPI